MIGGSFDPPHEGHLHIASWSLKLLPLENVWWIVTKQNPLKKNKPSEFAKRLENTRRLISDTNMLVKDIENKLNINYTIELIQYLKKKYPNKNFVWMMGADGMCQFHKWKDWEKIFHLVPIIIFARPGYTNFWNSTAATQFKENFVPAEDIDLLNKFSIPIWTFFDIPKKNISSTEIREKIDNI